MYIYMYIYIYVYIYIYIFTSGHNYNCITLYSISLYSSHHIILIIAFSFTCTFLSLYNIKSHMHIIVIDQ